MVEAIITFMDHRLKDSFNSKEYRESFNLKNSKQGKYNTTKRRVYDYVGLIYRTGKANKA